MWSTRSPLPMNSGRSPVFGRRRTCYTSATRWTTPAAPAQRMCLSSELPRRPVRAGNSYLICFTARAPSKCSETSMRSARVARDTKETQIRGSLKLDGLGKYEISTGIRFFDHMLELFAKDGGFDLKLKAAGDLDVDQHHTVEDVGIVLGQLFAKALGDRKGINRAGYFVMTMDETLAVVALDLGGRPALVYDDKVKVRLVGDLQTELVEDFFGGFVDRKSTR